MKNYTFCRESDKRQAAIARAKQEKIEQTTAVPTPDNDTTRSEGYDKKKESELHIIASLPKPQSLPAHQLFKDKRKVYQVHTCRCGLLVLLYHIYLATRRVFPL